MHLLVRHGNHNFPLSTFHFTHNKTEEQVSIFLHTYFTLFDAAAHIE